LAVLIHRVVTTSLKPEQLPDDQPTGLTVPRDCPVGLRTAGR
jgi:hypothetical protein